MTPRKTPEEITAIRQSGRVLAEILSALVDFTRAGVTTKAIDIEARRLIKEAGVEAAFLGYQGFPASICISVNDEIVHGIPSDRVLRDGDLVGLDFGIRSQGMITDSALTLHIGQKQPSTEVARLLKGTQMALDAAIDVVRDGVHVGQISEAIQKAFDRYQLSAIYNLTGHGVGHKLHEEPSIPNHSISHPGPVLRAGQTIAIEPIASLGTHDMYVASDKWTCMTVDGSLSAQFEHTVLVTPTGSEVLTAR